MIFIACDKVSISNKNDLLNVSQWIRQAGFTSSTQATAIARNK